MSDKQSDDGLPDVHAAMRRAFNLGQTYWQQADSEFFSQHRKADETSAKFKALANETAAAVAAALAARQPVGEAWKADLRALIDRYWELAYAEGRENRNHDTENGDAQAVSCAINAMLAASPAPQAEQAEQAEAPSGMVLVPKRMTKAMSYAVEQEGWEWEDLLAAAEAITEDEYAMLAADPAQPKAPVQNARITELLAATEPFLKLYQQADAQRDQPMDANSNINAQIAVKHLRRLVYAADDARATQPTASNAGERERFDAWVAQVKPRYWQAEAWQTEAWAMWQSISAALATKPPAGEQKPAGWVYDSHEFGDVWLRRSILNRPDGGANPPTKHHGSAVRNVRPFFLDAQPEQVAQDAVRTDRMVCGYPDCGCPTETPCLRGLPPARTAVAAALAARQPVGEAVAHKFFAKGWYAAAARAERGDLLGEIGWSAAYIKDRDRLCSGVASPAPQAAQAEQAEQAEAPSYAELVRHNKALVERRQHDVADIKKYCEMVVDLEKRLAAALESPTPPERVQPMQDALESIREHCKAQPSALAKAIVATCDSALAATPPTSPAQDAPYGYCPQCGALGKMRERSPNGKTTCANGHEYPHARFDATPSPQAATAGAAPTLKWCKSCGEGVTDFCRGKHAGPDSRYCPLFAALRASTPEAVPPDFLPPIRAVATVERQVDDNRAVVRWIFNPVPDGQELLWDHGDGIVTKESST